VVDRTKDMLRPTVGGADGIQPTFNKQIIVSTTAEILRLAALPSVDNLRSGALR